MVSLKTMLVAGAVAFGALFSASVGAQAQTMTAYTTGDLNLRAGPSTQYPSVIVMPRGSVVTVAYCEASQNWCFMDWYGVQGWASARYLTSTPPYQQGYPMPPQQGYPVPPQGYPQPPVVVVQPPQQQQPWMNGNGWGMWFYLQ